MLWLWPICRTRNGLDGMPLGRTQAQELSRFLSPQLLHGGYSQTGGVRVGSNKMSRGSDILDLTDQARGVEMRKFLLATSALAALVMAAPANAADMRVKAQPLPPPPPPCAQFGGFYLGGHVGAVYVRRETTDHDFLWNGATIVSTGSGFMGGLQGGYNWQARCTVFGFEADISWASDRNREFHGTFVDPDQDFFLRRELKSFGTLRARTGVVVDNVMLYVTGGLAWARINNSITFVDLQENLAFTASNDKTRWGWTAGFGSEWAFGGGWSIKSEALFMQFERRDFDLTFPERFVVGNPCVACRFTSDTSAWVARIGLNYIFGGYGAGYGGGYGTGGRY
jgi:outer membrane immunogenic protein